MGDDPAPMRTAVLSGWGRSTRTVARTVRPGSAAHLADVVGTIGVESPVRGAIARGLGRSYGDQATNAGGLVLDVTAIDAVPDTVPPDGVVTVGGGAALDDVIRTVVAQGWFVPVIPGTRHVTVGGAIAADIHGKNHHVDGSIGLHVRSLDLLHADGVTRSCSPTKDPDVFWATLGGLGLTGVVVAADIALVPVESSRLLVDTSRIPDIDALVAAMVEADRTATYSVAWIDLMAGGSRLGRSVLTTADFAPADAVSGDDPLAYRARSPLTVPPWVPRGLLRPAAVRAFNEAWFRRAPRHRRAELQTISRFFHPLDGVRDWNRVYGRDGFLQWQMVVPDGAEATLRRIVERISDSSAPSFLAVLKRLGPENAGPLSFPMKGWTLAADFPAAPPELPGLLDELDRQVVEAGGRIYLAKDGRLDPALVPLMYPRLQQWREVQHRVDPDSRWQSDMGRRLGL